jgi:hypothetical protein
LSPPATGEVMSRSAIPRLRQRLGFADRRTGDADRSGVALHAGDFDAFVGFGVRTQRNVMFGRDRGHAGDVVFQRHMVDDQGRRGDTGEHGKVGMKVRHGYSSRTFG